MDRARKTEPRSNKLLYEAELRFRKECHDRKMRAAKASVDNSAPRGFGQARRNLKKEMILEEHYSKIEHQNRLLLSRMSDIMTRPVGGGAAPGAGGVDNVCLAWEYGRSMNSRNRKAENERINAANKREYDNIRKVEPMYNHVEWDEHAAQAEKLAYQLTEFQRLPIGAEKRGSLLPASPRAGGLGSSFVGSASGGAGLSMSRLGSSGGPGAGGGGGGGGFAGSGVFSGGASQQHQQYQQHQHQQMYQPQPQPQQQQQQQLAYGGGSSSSAGLPGGMALNPSSSFIGAGGLGGSSHSASSGSQFQLPGLSHGLQDGSLSASHLGASSASHLGASSASASAGASFASYAPPASAGGGAPPRQGLSTPGGTALGSLGPSAAALLAKYGYSSVLGGGGLPPGGSAVPTVLGAAGGAYPMVQGGVGSRG